MRSIGFYDTDVYDRESNKGTNQKSMRREVMKHLRPSCIDRDCLNLQTVPCGAWVDAVCGLATHAESANRHLSPSGDHGVEQKRTKTFDLLGAGLGCSIAVIVGCCLSFEAQGGWVMACEAPTFSVPSTGLTIAKACLSLVW